MDKSGALKGLGIVLLAALLITPALSGIAFAQITEIRIGALYPITGDLASFGRANAEALKLAETDINTWLEQNNIPFRIRIDIVDTQTLPSVARDRFDALYAQGYRFFLGPMSSGELGEIISLVEAGRKALVISPSSTAPGLAIKDTVFRFPPPDDFQGNVLSKLFQRYGVTHIIIVFRNDDWGQGLTSFVERFFTEAGGTVVAKIAYDPKAPEFSAIVETVRAQIESLQGQGVPLDNIGVDIIGFEELASFLALAAGVDIFRQVKWFGSDGTALSEAIRSSPEAAAFADEVDWKNTITFAATDSSAYVFCVVKQRVGFTPDPYSLISYDAAWILTLAILAAGGPDDVDAVAEKVPEITQAFIGASGKINLNEFGDRAGSDYGIFEIVKVGEEFQWRLTELYSLAEDAISEVAEDPFAVCPLVVEFVPPMIEQSLVDQILEMFAPAPVTPLPETAPGTVTVTVPVTVTVTTPTGVSPATLIAAAIIIIVIAAAAAYFLLRRG